MMRRFLGRSRRLGSCGNRSAHPSIWVMGERLPMIRGIVLPSRASSTFPGVPVAPRVGARIETVLVERRQRTISSRPALARGLKHPIDGIGIVQVVPNVDRDLPPTDRPRSSLVLIALVATFSTWLSRWCRQPTRPHQRLHQPAGRSHPAGFSALFPLDMGLASPAPKLNIHQINKSSTFDALPQIA